MSYHRQIRRSEKSANGGKVDYGLKFYREIFNLESLHFGYWQNAVEPTMENLKKAQEDYIEFVLKWIPEGVKKILDVGCGIGSVALKLTGSGYDVSCLSPDLYQREVFLERTRGAVPFCLTKFEDFETVEKYDLVLMCESVQYLDMEKSFAKCGKVLMPGGRVLAIDYFRKENTPYYRTSQVEADFLSAAAKHGLSLVKSEDITEKVIPTLEAGRRIYDRYGLPVFELISSYLRQELPFVAKIGSALFRKKIKKLNCYVYEHTPEKLDPEMFKNRMRYGIYLFQTGGSL